MRRAALCLALLWGGHAAVSQSGADAVLVRPCAGTPVELLVNLLEPLAETTRSFYQGRVRVLIVGTGEPACCGIHVAVLMPDEIGVLRTCTAISGGPNGIGFGNVRFPETPRPSYDPAVGLTVPLVVSRFDGRDFVETGARLVIDRSIPAVTYAE